MKKSFVIPNSDIRLVRVGDGGGTEFEAGSLETSVKKISVGEKAQLSTLGQQWQSAVEAVMDTSFPLPPRLPMRRRRRKVRDDLSQPSFCDLLSLICDAGTNSKPVSISSGQESRSGGERNVLSPTALMPPPPSRTRGSAGDAPRTGPPPPRASRLHFSQIETLSSESDSSEDEELDKFVMEKLNQLQAETGDEKISRSEEAKKLGEGSPVPPVQAEARVDKKVTLGNEIKLQEESLSEVSAILDRSRELAFLLVLREGLSQFGDVSQVLASSFGTPDYLLVRVMMENDELCFIRVDLWHQHCSEQTRNFFWEEFIVMRNEVRKLVYDGKALLNCLFCALPTDEKLPSGLRLLDPIIGCWLLRPDNPVHSFKKVLEIFMPGLSVTNLGGVKPEDLTQQTGLLSSVCRVMYQQLEELNLWRLFYQTEMRIMPALVSMEREGLIVNQVKLKHQGNLLQQKMVKVKTEAEGLVGRSFNLSSPKQVGEVLFDLLKLDQVSGGVVGKTATGAKSTCESVLLKLKPFHPIVGLILEHRLLAKTKTTYVDGILGHLSPGGKVFTCWDQIAAATGRVTSVSPNLQAVPKGMVEIGDGVKVNIRASFQPSEGYKFLSADFEQIEFRLFGYLSKDPQINKALNEGGDVFRKLAGFWLDKSQSDVSDEDRERTKRVVYALMYGAGKVRLSEILGISVLQAASLITSFYLKFTTVRSFTQRIISMAERHGHLTTVLGRRRYFPFISSNNPTVRSQSQRQAFNFLIQGSAADLAKTGLLISEEKLAKAGVESKLVMMIHDEMVWQVHGSHLEKAATVVKQSLESCGEALKMKMETKVKISVGDTWGELEDFHF